MNQTLRNQAHRIAVQVEQEPGPVQQGRTMGDLTELRDLSIALVTPDTTYRPTSQTASPLPADTLIDVSALQSLENETTRFARSQSESGQPLFVAALYRPSSNLIVQVVQPPPPLYDLAQRSQVVLILGMVLALILALIGSFVAAYQVITPLTRISETAHRVAEGEFADKIRVDSRAAEFQDVDSRAAEFQDLADSLNRASDAFREKIEELERMTRLQSEFIGNVSHEVRNPIFSISGYLEVLGTSGIDDDQRKKYAEKALTNLNRLQNLFNDLIDIARLEYREDLINQSVFDLKDLVDEVAEMLRPKADEKDLDLEADVPRFFVRADRSRIRQVLTNLIENGIAYTGSGSVRCRVQRRLDKVRIEIVDTGQGIDKDHLDRIFEQILQAHGEEIHVESTKGRGTRFWFELPYEPEPEPEAVKA
ncbi:MAG: sensor histidine kinase [Bacteroidetes bacterium QH_2_63_10]|nr:MAG: sensor histidine kinase [Bacteroidetes bacterium QH_2_63_10]